MRVGTYAIALALTACASPAERARQASEQMQKLAQTVWAPQCQAMGLDPYKSDAGRQCVYNLALQWQQDEARRRALMADAFQKSMTATGQALQRPVYPQRPVNATPQGSLPDPIVQPQSVCHWETASFGQPQMVCQPR